MGGLLSSQGGSNAEMRRKADYQKAEEQQRLQEELKRKEHDEKAEERRKLEEKKRQDEELEQRKRVLDLEENDKARENRRLEYQHTETLKLIENMEKHNEREERMTENATQREHERLQDAQDKTFSILKDIFGKVQFEDVNQAALAACVLQSIQAGKPVDKDVLNTVSSKLPAAPPPQQLVEQIVNDVIRSDEMEENKYFTQQSSSVACRERSNSPEF